MPMPNNRVQSVNIPLNLNGNIGSFIQDSSQLPQMQIKCDICNADLSNNNNVSKCNTPNCNGVCCLKCRNPLGLRMIEWHCKKCKAKKDSASNFAKQLGDSNFIEQATSQLDPSNRMIALDKQITLSENNFKENNKFSNNIIKDIIRKIYE